MHIRTIGNTAQPNSDFQEFDFSIISIIMTLKNYRQTATINCMFTEKLYDKSCATSLHGNSQAVVRPKVTK